jgi:antitoxin (DNA-binding transcriptional repressor) of toxin-antitoxin stability system
MRLRKSFSKKRAAASSVSAPTASKPERVFQLRKPASDGGLFVAQLTVGRGLATFLGMKTVAIQDVQDRFEELAHDVEQGEVVTILRNGKPVFDLVAHRDDPVALTTEGGIDWEAAEAYLRSKGIVRTTGFIADDFDEPLAEDFLLRPLP